MSALFPNPSQPWEQRMIYAQVQDGINTVTGHALLHECQRCWAWVTDRRRTDHERWHRSVDTDQTTNLG